jgi:methylmalonyl-CoA decarboxylase
VLTVEQAGFTRTITLNNPAHRNAFSTEGIEQLVAAMHPDDDVRVAVIRALPGVGIWSAGHDIRELPQPGEQALAWENPFERALNAVANAPFPVIAAVEGSVWGGACNLVIACDIVVAMASSTFAMSPGKLGLPYPSVGVAQILEAVPDHIAREMLFTAQPMNAERMAQWGVVNRVVQSEVELTAVTSELCQYVTELAPLSLQSIKADMAALARHPGGSPWNSTDRALLRERAWSSDDYREGLTAFAERRPPTFTGH